MIKIEKTSPKKHPPKLRFTIRTMKSQVEKKVFKGTTFSDRRLYQGEILTRSILKQFCQVGMMSPTLEIWLNHLPRLTLLVRGRSQIQT